MTDSTNAKRQREWRARQAGKLPPPTQLICQCCGGNRSGRYGNKCWACWERLTPAGRAAKAKRVADSRAKKKMKN